MKKNQVYVALLIIVIAFLPLTLYLSSCQKSLSSEKIVAISKIKLFNKQFDAVNILDSKTNPVKNLQALSEDEILIQNSLYADLVNNSFSNLFNQIKSELTGEIKNANPEISTLIIYSNRGTILKSPVEINAISTFTHTGNKLEHRLYKVENGNTTEMKKYYALTDFIHHGDIKQTLLLCTTNKNAGWIMISDYPKIQSLRLQNKLIGIDVYSQVLTNNSPNPIERPKPKGCEAGVVCGDDTTSHCQYDLTWYCASIGCLVTNINDTMTFYNYYGSRDRLSSNTAYSFRDNFMNNYNIGLKYINYYNSLSAIGGRYKVVDINTAYGWYLFAQKAYAVANKLQNGNNADIIVDLDFKNAALAKINFFRTLDNSTQLQTILNDIENDLNYFYNKTRGQILSQIQ